MNTAEIDKALDTAERLGVSLVEYTIDAPDTFIELAWARWDRFKARLKLKVLGVKVADFAPLVEQLFLVPVLGPRPTAST